MFFSQIDCLLIMELEIQHNFPQPIESTKLYQHIQWLRETVLSRILPKGFPDLQRKDAEQWISHKLPIVLWDAPSSTPDLVTILFLCSSTPEVKAEKIILQLILNWLIPEKEVHIVGFNNIYFYKRSFSNRLFFAAEMKIMAEQDQDLSIILKNLPLLSHELGLSLSSAHYVKNQLDTKALSFDQKSTQIQGDLRRLFRLVPQHFDLELFREMSIFLALSGDEFRKFRTSRHLTRLVASHYLMRKPLLHHFSVAPEKRHLEMRLIRSKLHFPFGEKAVLGLSIAIALQDRYETFDDKHIIDGVQSIIASAKIIKGSFYSRQMNHDFIKYLYIELEKSEGTLFSQEEFLKLKKELKEKLKKRVERLIPSVFMIRNEEEVMRNILILSQELRYLSDLPQVMVNFEKQEGNELFFTVILIRIKLKTDRLMQESFNDYSGNFRFIADRVQHVGYVRKKNPKEANVFHICIPTDKSVLREDSSVNFYLARQKIISIINGVLGDIRDYNGGMILKQGELLSQLKHSFKGIAQKDQEILENFFFSLSPIEAQATASLQSLNLLFKLILEAAGKDLPKRDSYFQKTVNQKRLVFAVLRVKDPSFDGIINEEFCQLESFSKSLIKAQVKHHGTVIHGYIYETISEKEIREFSFKISKGIKTWLDKIRSQQELRLSFAELPHSLDPRQGGDDYSSNLIKMLFEGLTRIGRDSKPGLALAKSVEISSDQKQYVFKLRTSYWSDGSVLTAYDFEYAWKKILSPSFDTPFAYFFYPIKNARAAKKGEVEIDSVGIQIIDDMTIAVELEHPTPEFLEQTAHALYSPINRKHDMLHPNWVQDLGDRYVCNGPMKLKSSWSNRGHEFVKNTHYWDSRLVKLDKITITKNNPETALEMFKNDEIDWLGHPMRPWESLYSTCEENINQTKHLGTHWCVFNTQQFPFNHLKMRQAFSYAIDRQRIALKLSDAPPSAISPLPLINSNVVDNKLVKGDPELALQLFEESLRELGIKRSNFPFITLIFPSGSLNRKTVAQELAKRWEDVLGIQCRFEKLQFHNLFPKMLKGDFQIGTINWKSWINNAFYTLNAFQYRSNWVNFSKWEHKNFQRLLNEAQREIIEDKRTLLLKNAEELLIQECPVLPIYYAQYLFMHKKRLVDAFCSDSGNIDFKWASISVT